MVNVCSMGIVSKSCSDNEWRKGIPSKLLEMWDKDVISLIFMGNN